MYLEEVGRACGDWMELTQDRDRWWALVSTVMNFGVLISGKIIKGKPFSVTSGTHCVNPTNYLVTDSR